jgi:hypothetical protein
VWEDTIFFKNFIQDSDLRYINLILDSVNLTILRRIVQTVTVKL